MRRLIIILVCVLPMVSVTAMAQSDGPARWTLMYHVGRTSFDMKEVKDLMAEAISFYNSAGVQIGKQIDFPFNYLNGAELTRTGGTLRLGIGYAGSNSMAFGAYRDEAGLVRLKAEVSATMVYALCGLEDEISFMPGISAHLTGKVGSLSGRVVTEETVSFIDYHDIAVDRDLTSDARAFYVQVAGGLQTHLFGPIVAGLEAGYRSGRIGELQLWSAGKKANVNVSGWEFSVTVGGRVLW